MLKYKTYADNIRIAGSTRDNQLGRPLQIRELADAIGLGYETVRKIWHGKDKLYISRYTNDDLCRVLNLPKDEMWALAQREKVSQKLGYVPMQLIEDREGRELSGLWPSLKKEAREKVLKTARSLATTEQAGA